MKIENQQVPVLLKNSTMSFDFLLAEEAMRNCYNSFHKSENTYDGAMDFICRLGRMEHLNALQFVPIYFNYECYEACFYKLEPIVKSKYSLTKEFEFETKVYTNLGVIYDNCKPLYYDIIKGIVEKSNTELDRYGLEFFNPAEDDKLAYKTFKFTTSRATADQIVRYRNSIPAMQSTRYVDLSDLTVITECEDKENCLHCRLVADGATHAEVLYNTGTNAKIPKDKMRDVLPLATKTTLYVSARIVDWQHFVNQRTKKGAHNMIKELAFSVKEQLNL